MAGFISIPEGTVFNDWTVLKRGTGGRGASYLCRCKCGLEKEVPGTSLRHGKSKRCKSCSTKMVLKRIEEKKFGSIIGKKYGNLTIIAPAKTRYKNVRYFRCRCDCGNESEWAWRDIKSNKTKGCKKCCIKPGHLKHGECRGGKPPEFHIWRGIKERCLNKNNKGWNRYGGRGITICDEWKSDYSKFIEDMGKMPHPRWSVERIDNDKGYCKENCKWIPLSWQSRNTRRQPIIDGKKICITEHCKKNDICRFSFSYNLKRGKSLEEATKLAVNGYKWKFDCMTKEEWIKINGPEVK